MVTFACRVCGYIAFDNAPVDCPVCRAPIENFDKDPEVIRRPADPGHLSETEKMHVPSVTVSKGCTTVHGPSCFDLLVKVGEIDHPMDSEHYIRFIDFYIDKRFIARVHLTYKRLYPVTVLHINVGGGMLTVIGNCNVHGSWMKGLDLSEKK